MQRILSCIQPTGSMHIGNYFGAVKNWVNLQEEYECFFGVVDLHAMTMPYNPDKLRANTLGLTMELLACGIDPEKSTLFTQSLVPNHTELAWYLSCVTSYGDLSRMTQFKDKSSQLGSSPEDRFVSAGLFFYPVLQAADILAYKADYVPVGKDQEQHLELTREIVNRFNNQFGEYFPEPQPLFTEISKLMSLADPTKKMSKSLGEKHFVGLFEDEASIRRKVKRSVTDSGDTPEGEMSAGVKNLFNLLKACDKNAEHDSLLNDYNAGTLQYSQLKETVADALVELTSGFIARKKELEQDKKRVKQIVDEMSAKAREVTGQTVKEVRNLAGLARLRLR